MLPCKLNRRLSAQVHSIAHRFVRRDAATIVQARLEEALLRRIVAVALPSDVKLRVLFRTCLTDRAEDYSLETQTGSGLRH